MDVRKGYELRTPFLGRTVRPFHLAVTIATSVIAWSLIRNDPGGSPLAETLTHGVGWGALVAATLLTVGWWFRQETAAEWGLLVACGVWVSRAAYAALDGAGVLVVEQWPSVFLSLAWAVGAGGAYLLERADHRGVLGE